MDTLTVRTISTSPEVLEKREKSMLAIEQMCNSQVAWHETETVAQYRRNRLEGVGFPKPPLYERAQDLHFTGRDGHNISLRVIAPESKSNGILLHFHAGGFVIGSNKSYDNYLLHLSRSLELTAVSVEYRLAPEYPYPAAHNDAEDAVLFAASARGEELLGGPLRVLAGESAGGYLATWAALVLQRSGAPSQVAALLSSYPIYDIGLSPSCLHHTRNAVLSYDGMRRFIDTAFATVPVSQRREPDKSLLYNNLGNGLPPALFLCGTEDPLVDDSAFMATRWGLSGNKSELVIVPGAWHAFTIIPAGEVTDEGLAQVVGFAREQLYPSQQ